jgi:glycosyltransferase involved in cell wall biosynthesis
MITVIVVTYNRLNLVRQCIEGIIVQFQNKHEIIVVDNCSEDNTTDVLKNKYGSRIKVIRNDFKESLADCKNTGVRQACGEIIAFTDDDCVPAENWLERISSSFESCGCDIAAGPVRLLKTLRLPWWWSTCLNWTIGIAEINSDKFLPLGSNIAFRKAAYTEIATILHNGAGKEIVYTEDNSRINAAVKKGYKIKLDDSMVVYHNIGEERLSFKYLIKRSWLEGKHWAKNEKNTKILIYRIVAFLFNPLRFIVTLNMHYMLRTIVSISYIIECVKIKMDIS